VPRNPVFPCEGEVLPPVLDGAKTLAEPAQSCTIKLGAGVASESFDQGDGCPHTLVCATKLARSTPRNLPAYQDDLWAGLYLLGETSHGADTPFPCPHLLGDQPTNLGYCAPALWR